MCTAEGVLCVHARVADDAAKWSARSPHAVVVCQPEHGSSVLLSRNATSCPAVGELHTEQQQQQQQQQREQQQQHMDAAHHSFANMSFIPVFDRDAMASLRGTMPADAAAAAPGGALPSAQARAAAADGILQRPASSAGGPADTGPAGVQHHTQPQRHADNQSRQQPGLQQLDAAGPWQRLQPLQPALQALQAHPPWFVGLPDSAAGCWNGGSGSSSNGSRLALPPLAPRVCVSVSHVNSTPDSLAALPLAGAGAQHVQLAGSRHLGEFWF